MTPAKLEKLKELRKNESGERLNLKAAYKWILTEMPYEDFCHLARLTFFAKTLGYSFSYEYMVPKDQDTKRAREDYIKYLLYKLYQNWVDEEVMFSEGEA